MCGSVDSSLIFSIEPTCHPKARWLGVQLTTPPWGGVNSDYFTTYLGFLDIRHQQNTSVEFLEILTDNPWYGNINYAKRLLSINMNRWSLLKNIYQTVSVVYDISTISTGKEDVRRFHALCVDTDSPKHMFPCDVTGDADLSGRDVTYVVLYYRKKAAYSSCCNRMKIMFYDVPDDTKYYNYDDYTETSLSCVHDVFEF